MARIRSIKPEFPQSESMGRVSRDARLLFVMLWPICDDHGRTRASSRMLASLLFPYDDDAAKLLPGWLDELEAEDCIRRYEDGGSSYLYVPKWLIHQKIDKPSKAVHPDPPEHSPSPREHSPSPHPRKGREGKGEEGRGSAANASASGSRLPSNWELPEEWAIWAMSERPDIDAKLEGLKFADWWHSQPGSKGRKADWLATWRGWVRRADAPKANRMTASAPAYYRPMPGEI
jgi:hypothetical protein